VVNYQNPTDSIEWQSHRAEFEKNIHDWCTQNNIGLLGTYQPIRSMKFDKIIKLTIFELIESFDRLQQLDYTFGQEGKHLFYLTDNLIDRTQSDLLKNITIIPINELFGIVSIVDDDINTMHPTRLFNCFIQRVDSVRQSWFYFLKNHDLLDVGYVSFLLFQYLFYSDKVGVELFDHNHYHYNLNNLKHFHSAYTAMRDQVPYKNFPDTDDLASIVRKTKYSLILETYATSDDHIGYCYTEKLHRVLQIPTVNLFFSQKNSLSKLSELGFRIDDWMLEIDQYPWIQRQQKLLDILVNDSIDYNFSSMYNNALHNRDLIINYKKQFLDGSYLDKILSEIHKA
jgi:hypothetical protein